MDEVYKKLAIHLDSLPGGFPSTKKGVELKILKRIFDKKEAKIAIFLSMIPKTINEISIKISLPLKNTLNIINNMSRKGLIFKFKKNSEQMYMASQFVIGIWEYQVNNLNKDLVKEFNEYEPFFIEKMWSSHSTKQLRIIPIFESISNEMDIMPYENTEKIIYKQNRIVKAPCICRKASILNEKGCNNPINVCLIFGLAAKYYEENGLGVRINIEKSLNILKKSIKAGLVIQVSNSQNPFNMCMCCECCCHVLKNLKLKKNPSLEINANWIVKVNKNTCLMCCKCEKKCPMNAISITDNIKINKNKCIGCGLCILECKSNSLKIYKKNISELTYIPINTTETHYKIAMERKKYNRKKKGKEKITNN